MKTSGRLSQPANADSPIPVTVSGDHEVGQCPASSKCLVTDGSEAVGNSDAREPGVGECGLSDIGEAVGQFEIIQVYAACESTLSDARHAVWNRDIS